MRWHSTSFSSAGRPQKCQPGLSPQEQADVSVREEKGGRGRGRKREEEEKGGRGRGRKREEKGGRGRGRKKKEGEGGRGERGRERNIGRWQLDISSAANKSNRGKQLL